MTPAAVTSAVTSAGETVVRFGRTERAVHWIFSATFLLLAGTGLTLWVPALAVAVGQRAALRQVHIVAGVLLVPVTVVVALLGARRRVLASARELARLDTDDRAFLLGRPSRPGRFNGGQKLNTWWTVGTALLFTASGVVQWQWTRFDPEWRRGASQLHVLLTVLALIVLAGHLYLAAVHPSTRPSLRGAVTGRVRRAWAEQHHPRWEAVAPAATGAAGPTPEASGAHLARRSIVAGVAAGLVAIVSGGRFLPRIELPFSRGGWRIYNVAGSIPDPDTFELVVDGMVATPMRLDLDGLGALDGAEQISDFVCVTGWEVHDVRWRGVRIATLLDRAGVDPAATHLTFHSRDGVYTDSLAMADATARTTILATEMDGDPLPLRHGGPLRLVVASMYGYKSVKWLGRIEATDTEVVGYWQQRGYSTDARLDTSDRPRAFTGSVVNVSDSPYAIELPDGWSQTPIPGGGAVLRAHAADATGVEVSVVLLDTVGDATRDQTQSLLVGLERAGLLRPAYGALVADAFSGDTLEAEDGEGQRFFFAFFPDGRRIVQFQAQSPAGEWGRWSATFRQMAGSLRVR